MEFKKPYLEAMRQQAPQMFNQLRRSGALDAHVQNKAREASSMFNQLVANAEKLPSGLPSDPRVIREAEERVFATLIEFGNPDAIEQP